MTQTDRQRIRGWGGGGGVGGVSHPTLMPLPPLMAHSHSLELSKCCLGAQLAPLSEAGGRLTRVAAFTARFHSVHPAAYLCSMVAFSNAGE